MSMTNIFELFNQMEYDLLEKKNCDEKKWFVEGKGPFIKDSFLVEKSAVQEVYLANGQDKMLICPAEKHHIDLAVRCGLDASKEWRVMSGSKKLLCMHRISGIIEKMTELISKVETICKGISIEDAKEDVTAVVKCLRHSASHISSNIEDEKEGCVAVIVSSTSTLHQITTAITSSLAAGYSVVIKSAYKSPATVLLLANIFANSGFPEGIVSVLPGDKSVAQQLIKHENIDHVFFCGTITVARSLRRELAGTFKTFHTLLTTDSLMIVLESSDLNAVVNAILSAAWSHGGLAPWAVKNILVQESIYDKFKQKLKIHLDDLKAGNKRQKLVFGPISSADVVRNVTLAVEEALSKKFEVYTVNLPEHLDKMRYFSGVIIFGAKSSSRKLTSDQSIVPVVNIQAFRTPKEAVAMSNALMYCSVVSIWTENLSCAKQMEKLLKMRNIWINSHSFYDVSILYSQFNRSGLCSFWNSDGLPWCKMNQCPYTYEARLSPEVSEALAEVKRHKLLINGSLVPSDNQKYFKVSQDSGISPMLFALAEEKDVSKAVQSAVNALSAWSTLHGVKERAKMLLSMANNFRNNEHHFIKLLTSVCSSLKDEELGLEILKTTDTLYKIAAYTDRLFLTLSSVVDKNVILTLTHCPVGVVVLILPEECKLSTMVKFLCTALVFGNTVIVVPGRKDITHLMEFTEVILQQSKFPSGVISVLTGNPETIAELLGKHNDISSIWCMNKSISPKNLDEWASDSMKTVWYLDENTNDTYYAYDTKISCISDKWDNF